MVTPLVAPETKSPSTGVHRHPSKSISLRWPLDTEPGSLPKLFFTMSFGLLSVVELDLPSSHQPLSFQRPLNSSTSTDTLQDVPTMSMPLQPRTKALPSAEKMSAYCRTATAVERTFQVRSKLTTTNDSYVRKVGWH